MKLLLIAFAVIVSLTTLFTVFRRWRKRQRQEQLKRFKALIEQAAAGRGPERSRILAYHRANWREQSPRQLGFPLLREKDVAGGIDRVVRLEIAEARYEAELADFQKALEQWRASSPGERLAYLDRVLDRYLVISQKDRACRETGFEPEKARKQKQRLISDKTRRLLPRAESDYEAFDELRHHLIAYELPRPNNWLELVSAHFDAPRLDHYAVRNYYWHSRKPPRDVLDMAAEAVRDGNIPLAKYVLAYCGSDADYRDMVGDTLRRELAMLIAASSERRTAKRL